MTMWCVAALCVFLRRVERDQHTADIPLFSTVSLRLVEACTVAQRAVISQIHVHHALDPTIACGTPCGGYLTFRFRFGKAWPYRMPNAKGAYSCKVAVRRRSVFCWRAPQAPAVHAQSTPLASGILPSATHIRYHRRTRRHVPCRRRQPNRRPLLSVRSPIRSRIQHTAHLHQERAVH